MFRRRQDFSILHPEHVVVRLRDESKVEVNGTSQVGGGYWVVVTYRLGEGKIARQVQSQIDRGREDQESK